MDTTIETPETTTDSFAAELGKSFAISLAGSAGAFAGMILIGVVVKKVQDREAKKTAKTTTENK